jgi:hypothetical protein
MAEAITSSDQASTGESLSLTTYYNYIKAWNIAYNQRYDSEGAFIDEIRKLASISKRPEIYKDNFDKGSYIRGILTLQLMNDLPVDKHPKLTFTANIWLPVHSYYAIEGVGLALLSIRLQNPPQRTHIGFSSSFTNPILRMLFPYPFNGLCEGGPKPADFSFRNLDTSAAEVKAQKNIANPSQDKIDDYIGKSLSTTRKKKLAKRFKEQRGKEVRSGCTRRNLSAKDKARICNKECGTSICDFIYRMRERSNYDNPIMYLHGTNDADSALSHYKDLLLLTKVIIGGIDTLIEIYLGKKELDKIKSELKPFEMPVKDDIPF